MATFFETSISYIKGVGPKRAALLQSELGLHTVWDVLTDFPYRYIDRSSIVPIHRLYPESHAQVRGVLFDLEEVHRNGRTWLEGYLRDSTGILRLVWFQGIKWLKRNLMVRREYLVFGKVQRWRGGYSIAHPEMTLLEHNKELRLGLYPVYSTTEKLTRVGLDARGRRIVVERIWELIQQRGIIIPENLPTSTVQRQHFLDRHSALRAIHFPSDAEELRRAQERLKFEELFFLQLQLLYRKVYRKRKLEGYVFERVGEYFHAFYQERLPFELTGAQKRVVKEIRRDFKSGKQMNRLLQGDVGSGKTIVALLSMLMALDNGYQACLMAPTEILAQQHFHRISQYLYGLPIRVELLTGSVRGKKRDEILQGLRSSDVHIVIGTHALIEPSVEFARLGLAIIDEQHRFGVAQRAQLWKKSTPHPPHILVMTATPIPRTLSMTLYGDLDVSIIDELPPGRKPVKTIWKTDNFRGQIMEFVRTQIHQGRQVYIVYPLIEESEKLALQNLFEGYERVRAYFPPPTYQISIVHGRMKPEDKEREMARFKEGITHIMMSTTVIEVGVDVPNATVMIIENAERFGLSQLHQLRGRVGRGAAQSYCILLSGHQLSEDARTRLQTMCRTNDGFEIAEVDLKLRGPGDIEGTRQSGLLDFKLVDIVRDTNILQRARSEVLRILQQDPELQKEEHRILRSFIESKVLRSPWGMIS